MILDPDLRIPWQLMPLPGDPDKTHQCVHVEGTPHPPCVHQELTATPRPQFSIPSSMSESCHCSRLFLSPCPNQELPALTLPPNPAPPHPPQASGSFLGGRGPATTLQNPRPEGEAWRFTPLPKARRAAHCCPAWPPASSWLLHVSSHSAHD